MENKNKYTLFVCSDIHGAYTPWMKALDDAGFDANKDNHKIIVCGDLFDRMPEAQKVYNFTKEMLDKDKLIYIKGNHEQLMLECIDRKYPLSHDWSNGTAQSIIDLAPHAKTFEQACTETYAKVSVLFDKMVNYVESEHFIFCHGFIPVNCEDSLPPWYRKNRKYSKMENWREAHQHQWDDAAWLCSYDMIEQGFGIEKCIVAGHWHASYGRYKMYAKPEFSPYTDFSPFYHDDGLIMIDAATAYSNKVNVLVIEDEFITAQN